VCKMNKDELIREIDKVYQHSDKLKDLIDDHEEIILIGNGASCAIASHMAVDYTKQLQKRAFAFTDGPRLTCYVNDYGSNRAYAQFVDEFAIPGKTLVILISSSGNSKNILLAANRCEVNEISWAALSGKDHDNKLHSKDYRHRKLNAWVDSQDYGVVECTHQVLLHSIMKVT